MPVTPEPKPGQVAQALALVPYLKVESGHSTQTAALPAVGAEPAAQPMQ